MIQTLTENLSKKTNLSIKILILKKDLSIETIKDNHKIEMDKDLSTIETENLSTEIKKNLSIELKENLLIEVIENHSKKMTENPLIVTKENHLIVIKEDLMIVIKENLLIATKESLLTEIITKENHIILKDFQIKSLTNQDKTETSNIKKNNSSKQTIKLLRTLPRLINKKGNKKDKKPKFKR